MSPDQFAQEIVQSGQVPAVVGEVVRGKALAGVLEAAKVVDASGRVVDLSELTFLDADGYLDYDFDKEGAIGARLNPGCEWWGR